MKKILIIIALLVATIYLSSAVNISLNSWSKLEGSSWDNLSSVLNKVDISGNNLNVNWKLSVSWKICLTDNSCLGECEENYNWDTLTNSCKPEWGWNDDNTVLLLHFDSDTNDSSSSIKTIIKYWNASISNSDSKFWWWALYLDWSWDYLRLADHSDWDFWTWDWTIDLWINLEAKSGYQIFWNNWWENSVKWIFVWLQNNIYYFQSLISHIFKGTQNLTWTWHHIAVARQGDIVYNFVDGNLIWTKSYAWVNMNNSYVPKIWNWYAWAATHYTKWYIDEFRISKWVARWTTDFTVPTWPYN
jgi:hypothetical protein